MSNKIFVGKVFLLITGASQGIGKTIAQTLSPLLENDSHVLLLARNINNLMKIADQLPKHVSVHFESIDLSKATASELKGKYFVN
jgi:short-subunit dehydrogenase